MNTYKLNNTIKKQFNELTFKNRNISPKILFKGLERLLMFYDQANKDQLTNGLNWYINERKNIVNMKRRFNYYSKNYKESKLLLTTENVCEIVSMLSPLLEWSENKKNANNLLIFYSRNCIDEVFNPFNDLHLKMIESNYKNALSTLESIELNKIKTFAYKPRKYVNGVWNGEFHEITNTVPFIQASALKTFNFKNNLLYANVTNQYVTIDSHMTNAFFNTVGKELLNDNNKVYAIENTDKHIIRTAWLTPRSLLQYTDISNVIKLASKLVGVRVDQFQAVVWNVVSDRLNPIEKKHISINPINNNKLLKVA